MKEQIKKKHERVTKGLCWYKQKQLTNVLTALTPEMRRHAGERDATAALVNILQWRI